MAVASRGRHGQANPSRFTTQRDVWYTHGKAEEQMGEWKGKKGGGRFRSGSSISLLLSRACLVRTR